MCSKINYSINSEDVIGDDSDVSSLSCDINCGQIVEKVVKKDKMSISEISRKLNVSRRTLYNWFKAKDLSFDTIEKIGLVIDHDFSEEFPETFPFNKNLRNGDFDITNQQTKENLSDPIYYWMDKYIKLLERFNEVLPVKYGKKNT
jgi:transcriptional regulator with XRE-family HTH domain